MMSDGNGEMYTNIQSIKNLMKSYDKDGDYISPVTGLAGLLLTNENAASRKRIIPIPESSKDKMFEAVKNIYLNNNGMTDGTGKTEIYMDMYRQMKSDDRLSAGYTLRQYHLAYTQAFVSAIKAVDPTWEYGKAVPSGALDSVTRESVESQLVKSGNTFVKKPSSGSTLDIQI